MMKKKDITINWNKMANAYEDFTNSPNSYSNRIEWPAIKLLIPNLENKAIIDLGCGTGRFTFLLEDYHPKKIIGMDISSEMIDMARMFGKDKKSTIEFIQNDIEDLSCIEDESIDFVFSSTTFHYLKDLKRIMQEIKRILKPGGLFILSVIHPVYSAQYPIINDEEWKVKYLNKELRAYIQPWIEYNNEIENYLSFSYHHTMSDYINNIIEAELMIKSLSEPLPPEDWKASSLSRYNGYMNTPTYAIFEIKK